MRSLVTICMFVLTLSVAADDPPATTPPTQIPVPNTGGAGTIQHDITEIEWGNIRMLPNGNYQVSVDVKFTLLANHSCGARIFDEDTGTWKLMHYGEVNGVQVGTYTTTTAANKRLTFKYEIASTGDWGQDIADGIFPFAFVNGFTRDQQNAVTSEDDIWLEYIPAAPGDPA